MAAAFAVVKGELLVLAAAEGEEKEAEEEGRVEEEGKGGRREKRNRRWNEDR